MTGRALSPETAVIDHVIPISRGGSNTMENVQILHDDVNQAKRALTIEEFLAVCREVTLYRQTTYRDLSAKGND